MKTKRHCTICNSEKYYCKGLCKNCYNKQHIPLIWSDNYLSCKKCHTTESRHVAHGLCGKCYSTQKGKGKPCECGCGKITSNYKGEPRRFMKGHWAVVNNARPEWREMMTKRMSGKNNPQYRKFGKDHPSYGHETKPEVREQRRQRRLDAIHSKQTGLPTDIEIILSDILKRLRVKSISQHKMYNKFIVDEFLPKYNLVIEAHGGYWHGDPRKYKSLSKMQIDNTERHLRKAKYLTSKGHRVLFLWEKELKNRPEWCKDEILYAIENFFVPNLQDSVQSKPLFS